MEAIIFLLVIVAFIAVIFINESMKAKKTRKEFIQYLHTDYGKYKEKEIQAERYEHISGYYAKHIKGNELDDITWNDLNMDALFKRMNYTNSSSGEEYLYYVLRNIDQTQADLDEFEECVAYFQEHEEERVKLQLLFHDLGATGKYSLYDYLDYMEDMKIHKNFKHIFMDLLFIPCIVLIPFSASIGFLGLVALITYNMITYNLEKADIEPYIVSLVYILKLIRSAEKLSKAEIPICKEKMKMLHNSIQELKNMKRGSFFVETGGVSTGTGNPADLLLDYMKMIFHIDLIAFNRMISTVRGKTRFIDEMNTVMGYIDTSISVGAFRASALEGYVIPEFTQQPDSKEMELVEGYHPLISNPVKNSICTDKGVLITGSNASGKSTFLKMVAINSVLAQTIHTVCAAKYKAPIFRIYSSMALRDDLGGGDSYYIVEIKALKRILSASKESDKPILCFVDEVLRGTNTVERIAASTEIMKNFSKKQVLCFAATHDIELTRLLDGPYSNYHFMEEIENGDIAFSYKLMKGPATTRNAIRLLEMIGYDESIIEKAMNLAQKFVDTGSWDA